MVTKKAEPKLVKVTVREDGAIADGSFDAASGEMGYYKAGTEIEVDQEAADSLKEKRLI